MSKEEVTKIWGNMVGAILKYNRTRISMRDELGKLLEEENDLLRRKVILLFKNLREYEDIIEEEWLSNIIPTEIELTAESLTTLFDNDFKNIAPIVKTDGPLGSLEPEWTEKIQKADSLLSDRDEVEKDMILKNSLMESATPREFMINVISQMHKQDNQYKENSENGFYRRSDKKMSGVDELADALPPIPEEKPSLNQLQFDAAGDKFNFENE